MINYRSKLSIHEKLVQVLAPYHGQQGALVPVLQKVQETLGYLPEEAISEIAQFLRLSESEVYGVASFYAQFRFEQQRRGEHMINVCGCPTCYVRGGQRILETVGRELGIKPRETTENHKFSLDKFTEVGCCALAPVMVVDETVYGRMTPAKVKRILDEYR